MIFSKNLKFSVKTFTLYLFLSIFFLLVIGLVKTQNAYAANNKFEACKKQYDGKYLARPLSIGNDCTAFCYIERYVNDDLTGAPMSLTKCCEAGYLFFGLKTGYRCKSSPTEGTKSDKTSKANDDDDKVKAECYKKLNGDVANSQGDKGKADWISKCSKFCKASQGKFVCSGSDSSSDSSSSSDSTTPWEDRGVSNKKLAKKDDTKAAPTCTVGYLDYFICPISEFLSEIADNLYGLIESFLEIDSNTIFGAGDNGISSAFTKFLSIANIVLAIAFLLIIYSEATGNAIGSLSRYSVQKLLPRLIIFTILVNISFYLCAMAVDISNILGANLKGMFEGMGDATLAEANQGEGEAAGGWSGLVTSSMTGDLLIIGSATASIAAIALGALSVVLPLLLLALIVLIVIWLILIIRQALVILLCVIAPVAIACALLPNTQKLFNKWKNAFIAMLIVYPAVSLIFGASYVASNILMTQDGATMKIAAMACRVIPMAAVPFVIAGSFKSVGAAGAMLSGKAQGALKKQGRKVNAARKEGFDRSIGKRGTLKASSNLANKAQKGINTITKGRFDGGRSLRKAANAYHQSEASLDSAAMAEANLAVDGMSYEEKAAILNGQDYADSYTTRAVLNDMMPNADAYSINDAMLAHAGNRDRKVRETLTGGDNKLLDINTKNAINKGNYVENKIDQSTINQSVLSNVDNKSNADIARSPSIDIEFTKGAAAMEDLRSGTTYNTDKLRGRYNNVLSDNIAASNASDDTIDSLSNV